MKIYLDNIVFSLQKAGGISVVWNELLKRILNDTEIQPRFIDNSNSNIFRKKLLIPSTLVNQNPFKDFPVVLKRYLNPNKITGSGIFHSSYYRTTNNQNFVNITTVYDFTYEYFRSGLPRYMHKLQKGAAIKKSKKIICISQNTKDDLLKFYPAIPESSIAVIYNGVNELYGHMKNKNGTQLNSLVSFSSGEYILYVGDRKSLYKNFRLVVETCKESNIPLVMAGGGMLTKKEKQLLDSSLGINNYISLTGIRNEDLNILYNHAMCLIYPSLYEGFGIPVVEAQKSGCPVICSNSSSIPEVAGKGAYVISNISKEKILERLLQLKNRSGEKEKIIKAGFQNANRFSWEKCYNQTKQVYKEVYEKYFS